MLQRPCVLVFAGVDPSGGAGIQADISAIAAMGAHALPVVTTLTVQDNDHVHEIQPVAADFVAAQARALIDKIQIAAVKVGIIGSRANAEAIAKTVGILRERQPRLPLVLDTVLASGHGDALSESDPVRVLQPLLPLATLLTPNLPEAARLTDEYELPSQAQALRKQAPHVLIKGGHGDGDVIFNHWFSEHGERCWSLPRLPGSFHGTGCTLASAIAALLAQGLPMADAIFQAQTWCHRTLEQSYAIAEGQRIPNRVSALAT